MIQFYVYISVTALCTILLWIRSKQARRNGSLPPSPIPDPLIGNMRAMMSIVDEPRAYRDWGLELGSDIISVTLPGQVIIVLNSQEAVDELLVKRSSIYSDRPYIPMTSSDNLTGWGNHTAIIGYGERWRFQRKVMHEVLQKDASDERWPLIERDSRLALQRILANPGNFNQELRCLFKTVEIATKGFGQAVVVPNFVVNTFHWLQYVPEWFPGAAWKAKANAWRRQKDRMLHVPFEWTKDKMSTGTEVQSMLSTWLNKYMGEEPEEESTVPAAELEDRLRWVAGGMFAAGSNTSVSALRTFILAMAMHPDIQAKAQAEIDSVIGTRLPELADQDSLPYVQCIVKEAMRWKITLPLALPHACTQDDTYKGYHIPKGAIVALSNNPDTYPDPERFNPDRFLDPSVPEAPSFGFGRRICPGLHHAEAVIFITAAGLLSMFDIRPEQDETGAPIPLPTETSLKELLRQVPPFKCRITPRSEKHERIVREWVV
ncbi:cytochrome P450 [Rhizoctonia solani]|nr:cytochrome P450 [Rhizoctonia solani]